MTSRHSCPIKANDHQRPRSPSIPPPRVRRMETENTQVFFVGLAAGHSRALAALAGPPGDATRLDGDRRGRAIFFGTVAGWTWPDLAMTRDWALTCVATRHEPGPRTSRRACERRRSYWQRPRTSLRNGLCVETTALATAGRTRSLACLSAADERQRRAVQERSAAQRFSEVVPIGAATAPGAPWNTRCSRSGAATICIHDSGQ